MHPAPGLTFAFVAASQAAALCCRPFRSCPVRVDMHTVHSTHSFIVGMCCMQLGIGAGHMFDTFAHGPRPSQHAYAQRCEQLGILLLVCLSLGMSQTDSNLVTIDPFYYMAAAVWVTHVEVPASSCVTNQPLRLCVPGWRCVSGWLLRMLPLRSRASPAAVVCLCCKLGVDSLRRMTTCLGDCALSGKCQ